jgi:hypothetical protein
MDSKNNNEDEKNEENQEIKNNEENEEIKNDENQITYEQINNITINENNEITFTLPLDQNNNDIYSAIELMLEEMQKNSNIFNENYKNDDNNEFISFDIEFEFITPSTNNEENTNYFLNCKEINQKVGKAVKIKENDTNLLNESCLICMNNYKINEFKRTLPKCSHYFHKKCIDKWLKKKSSCPICRDELITDY